MDLPHLHYRNPLAINARWRSDLSLVSSIRRHLTLEVLVRVVADILLLNMGLIGALCIRFMGLVLLRGTSVDELRQFLVNSVAIYLEGAALLTPLGIAIFAISGFYSRSRSYRGRYKFLVIAQGVTLTYLVFGFLSFFLPAFSSRSRSALILSWLLTVALVVGARLCASVWTAVVALEQERPSVKVLNAARKVLIIGGAGYIGSVLCRQLLDRGYKVRVLDALLYGDESIRDLTSHKGFELVHGDSRDVGAIVRAVRGMDSVVHLGEIVGDPACALDEETTLEVNLAATCMVTEVAKGYGVQRFVYASSCSVYGASDQLLDERSALNPVSLYAKAKIGSEQALQSIAGDDFHPIILRFATVFGISPRPRFDLVINLLTAKAVVDGKITIFGGDQWRPFVHVSDVARAITLCVERPVQLAGGQIFNVGSDAQNYTIAEIGNLVHQSIPSSRLLVADDDADRRNYHVSFAKIRNQLGFDPKVTVSEGIQEIAQSLTGGAISDYCAPCYSNLKFLNGDQGSKRIRAVRMNGLYQNSITAMERILVA